MEFFDIINFIHGTVHKLQVPLLDLLYLHNVLLPDVIRLCEVN